MEEKFQFSHIILSLFLIAFGSFICYWIISSWIFFDFTALFILHIPIFLFAGVLPLGFGLYYIFYQLKLLIMKGKK